MIFTTKYPFHQGSQSSPSQAYPKAESSESRNDHTKTIVELDNQIKQIDYPNLHPHHKRYAYMGELIQLDACKHNWFGNVMCYLHAAIADATGTVVTATFDNKETLVGYFHVLDQFLNDYGIPFKF